LHGLPTPILSVHIQHLTHLLWYCYCDLLLLSGCTHRCCDRDNRYRGQSDYRFAYHGACSSVSGHAPQPLDVKLNSSDTVARVRQYRAVPSDIATSMRLAEHQGRHLVDKRWIIVTAAGFIDPP
jgi:hypothetical protein